MRWPGLLLAAVLHSAAAAAPVAAGQAEADWQRGLALRSGAAGVRDAHAAAQALTRAAEAGHPAAMFTLANMLRRGEGVAVDAAAAQRWLEVAADLDYPAALQELAMHEPDAVRAELLMRQAAHALLHQQRSP